MIKVYYAPPSIYGRKVLSVLEEKDLDYEIVKMSFEAGDHNKADYLAINPNGEIPALMDEEFVVYESTAIIEYLDDEYPDPPLLPEDSEGRARVRMIEDFCDLHLFPRLKDLFIKKILNSEEPEENDLSTSGDLFQRLETYLAGKKYLAGDFSLADCAAMSAIASVDALGLSDRMLTNDTMKAYAQRLRERPGFKGANLISFETSEASG